MAVVISTKNNRKFIYKFLLFKLLVLVGLFCVLQLSFVYCANAATWPVSCGTQLSPSLSFHVKYTRAGKTYIHQGIDIACSAGEEIVSPVSGSVSFIGMVPSGDSLVNGGGKGQTMCAVSIKMSSGKTLTLSPVENVAVKRGSNISEGESLATVCASGDRSSTSTHLHMGLKKNKTYYDPMSLFSAVKTQGAVPLKLSNNAESKKYEFSKANQAVKSSSVLNESYSSKQQSLQRNKGGISSSVSGIASLKDDAKANNSLSENQGLETCGPGAITSGNVSWSPNKEEDIPLLQKVSNQIKKIGNSCLSQLQHCKNVVQEFSVQTGFPLIVLYVCIVLISVLILGAICFAFASFIVPNLRNVGRKAVSFLLKHLRGDSMQKLFPASGDAFMPRSRLARRR